MKSINLNYLFALILMATYLHSCCTQKYCIGINDIQTIRLINFPKEITDSLTIEIRDKNVMLIQKTVIPFPTINTLPNTLELYLTEKINSEHIYSLTLHKTNQNYTLSNFTSTKQTCNCPGDYYDKLTSYSLNGKIKNESSINIPF